MCLSYDGAEGDGYMATLIPVWEIRLMIGTQRADLYSCLQTQQLAGRPGNKGPLPRIQQKLNTWLWQTHLIKASGIEAS